METPVSKKVSDRANKLVTELLKAFTLQLAVFDDLNCEEQMDVITLAFSNISVSALKAMPIWDVPEIQADKAQQQDLVMDCISIFRERFFSAVQAYKLGSNSLDTAAPASFVVIKGKMTPISSLGPTLQ